MPNTREKLIELLRDVQYLGGLEEKIAHHLIANGVSIQEESHWATEQAYKNGYEQGKQDAVKWIPTIGRKPTKADADKYGRVLAMEYGMITLVNYRGPINYPDQFPYWLPIHEPQKGE